MALFMNKISPRETWKRFIKNWRYLINSNVEFAMNFGPQNHSKILTNNTCDHCSKKSRAAFGIQNDMIRDLSSIPREIIKLIREMTMIEEMLLSPVLPIMTVCRLATGANISRGFVANLNRIV